MKTNVMKRAMALILAALIVLGTLGYLFSTMAYAAMSGEQNVGDNYKAKYEVTNGLSNGKIVKDAKVTIKVDLTTPSSLSKEPTVVLDQNGAFKLDTGDSASKVEVLSGSDTNWVISFTNVKYNNVNSGNEGTLQFKVDNSNTLTLAISECEKDEGGDGGDDGNNDTPLPSNMSYTLTKVYSTSSSNPSYDYQDPSKNDPSISKNRYVDMLVRFSISGAEEEDIWKLENGARVSNIQVLVDRGSFRFRSGDDNSITIKEVTEYADGVACLVELRGLRYTGTGNSLAFTIQSKEGNTPYIFEQFSTTVDSCVEYKSNDDDDNDTDYSSMAMATPYVIVSNYSYGGVVTAGQTFPLTLTFYNTSKNIDVQNMMITLSMPDALMLTSSSNTFYVETLGTEETVTKTVQVTAKANADPSSHNVEVSMKYQYIDDHTVSRKDNSTQETISIPVVQVDRFEVTGVEVSPEIYLGEESDVTVNYVNKGRSDVYNLSVEISGDIQNPGQQQNLGNLSSGATGSADFYIMPNAEGVCTGEIKITYEDTNMEEKTVTMTWSTNVVDPMAGMDMGMMPGMGGMDDPSLTPVEEEKSPWPFVAGGVAVAAVVIGLLVRRRILKKRSEEEDANL